MIIELVGNEEAERCVLHYSHIYQELVAAEILRTTEPGRVYRLRDIVQEINPLPPGPWFPKLLRCRAFRKIGKDKYLRVDLRTTEELSILPDRREEWTMENLCQIRANADLP